MFFTVFVTFCSGIMSANFWESNDSGNKTLNYSVRNNKLGSYTNKFTQIDKDLGTVRGNIKNVEAKVVSFTQKIGAKKSWKEHLGKRSNIFSNKFGDAKEKLDEIERKLKLLVVSKNISDKRAKNILSTSSLFKDLSSVKTKTISSDTIQTQEKEESMKLIEELIRKLKVRKVYVDIKKDVNRKKTRQKSLKETKTQEKQTASRNITAVAANSETTEAKIQKLEQILGGHSENLNKFKNLEQGLKTELKDVAEKIELV